MYDNDELQVEVYQLCRDDDFEVDHNCDECFHRQHSLSATLLSQLSKAWLTGVQKQKYWWESNQALILVQIYRASRYGLKLLASDP